MGGGEEINDVIVRGEIHRVVQAKSVTSWLFTKKNGESLYRS